MQLSAGPKGLGQVATGCRLKVNDDSSRDLAGFPRFYSAAYNNSRDHEQNDENVDMYSFIHRLLAIPVCLHLVSMHGEK
jgi:hypothetical protein